ncbi:lipopolysaccharide biosynthesis protein [Chroococcus sp. FPU101]|uniref:lipopolysaccharide biosynthesis protein n=1 Tax=Chroococcus sp. FPU101 TaxID=1974212 RepID=UPI001A8FA9F1|nr:lipopolysaccharide biosynthesis protein [Chroococcus sp. FPU101]GFE67660.1 polysaccharide biosynthesis protein [Chroococcus sp. FPU101]
MSIKQKVVNSVFWSAAQGFGNQILSLIIFSVLARLLTPQDFGLVAIANVFLAILQIFLEQGFAQALIQKDELTQKHLDTAFWTTVGMGVLITFLGITTAPLFAEFFRQPQLTPVIQWLSLLCLILSLSQVQQALLERKFAFKAIATRFLFGTIIGGFVGVVMALKGYGVWSLVTQQIIQATVATIFLWKVSDWRPKWYFSKQCFQDLFNFGIHILGFKIVSFFNDKANDFLIGYFLGAVALGYYSLASRIFSIITQIVVKTSQDIALPTFSRLQHEPEKMRQAFYQATQFTSLVAFPTFLGIALLAPELIFVSFGQQWLAAIPLIQILSLMGILRSVTYFTSSVFVAMGKPSWWFRLGLLKMVLNLSGFLIAYPFGIIAVTWAYVIRLYIAFPVGQWAISKLLNISWSQYLRQFIPAFVGSIIMITVIFAFKSLLLVWSLSPLLILILCSLVAFISYAVAIYLIAPKMIKQIIALFRLATSRPKET